MMMNTYWYQVFDDDDDDDDDEDDDIKLRVFCTASSYIQLIAKYDKRSADWWIYLGSCWCDYTRGGNDLVFSSGRIKTKEERSAQASRQQSSCSVHVAPCDWTLLNSWSMIIGLLDGCDFTQWKSDDVNDEDGHGDDNDEGGDSQ